MDERKIREDMCAVGRRLWERDLIGATEGNLSARLGPDRILCTPSGHSKGHLVPDDLIVVDGKGAPIGGGAPSSEIRLHLGALRERPDCGAVVHAHPPTATAFSVAGVGLPDDLLPEAMYVLGPVATAPFSMPGTEEVADILKPLWRDHKTILLSHHGAAALGRDLWDAAYRMETLERVARVVVTAGLLGSLQPLPADALERLRPFSNGKL